MVFRITDNGHANAEPCSRSALWNGFRGVVGTFRVDVGPQLFEESFYSGFRKQHYIIHRTKSRDQQCARVFIEDGAARSLQAADAQVIIDANDENVAFPPRAFQIADVADVQSIEATVGKDNSFAATLVFCKFLLQRFAKNDFAASFTHVSGSRSGNLATNGIEEFLT